MLASHATYYDADAGCPSEASGLISINSARKVEPQPVKCTKPDSKSRQRASDPMQDYQPIVKHLKNMALRNRNLLSTQKVEMPVFESQKISTGTPGNTTMPNFLRKRSSHPRMKYFNKYLSNNDDRARTGSSKPVLNMVYANKQERQTEHEVCNYILTKVLNQGNLTRITGITTQQELIMHQKNREMEQKLAR